ncbi:hypothetical protein DM860_017929 [Cuscuta australis]|uniref:Uncharacterized protein n=1 Tax=Cuscuta australis TaxID=267555 RepID=A0A328DV66_9ASTE|nr:hypothetical protein DM860_017929 [Cuscuta australis]
MPKLQPPPEFSPIHTQSLSADRLTTVPHPTWAYRRSPFASLWTISSTLWLFFQSSFHISMRYLFTIGLSPVFSLRRNSPPNLGCIPKQPDSKTAPRGATVSRPDGALTLSGAPFQGTWA